MDRDKLSIEQKYILDNFSKNFDELKNMPIALYGVGINTKVILEYIKDFNIIGLMDLQSTGSFVYGYEVLSYEEVIEKVKVIIIVARKSVLNIIYKRIEFLEKKYGIQIYTISGERLSERGTDSDEYNKYWSVREEKLYNLIDANDAISFDIFDTLIMRKILQPKNIFDVIENELKEKNRLNISFKQVRIYSEEKLSEVVETPNIHEIYDEFQRITNIDDKLKEQIKLIEFETELKYIAPRFKMIEVLRYASQHKKKIYLISDMYWTKDYMKKLLDKCGVVGYTELMISCETRASKNTGKMYEYYKKIVCKKRMLHIGDNYQDDIIMANLHSISTFHVMSAYDMLVASKYRELLVKVNGLTEYNILGLFVFKAFNNPFELSEGKGKLIINDLSKLGYLFIGPLVLTFTIWLINQLIDCEYEKILFTSRDGYLIESVYNMLSKSVKDRVPKGIYFKTSRRAVTVASIDSMQDISNLMLNPFKGDKRQLLKERFGIRIDNKIDENYSAEDIKNKYGYEIIANARSERKCYHKYIEDSKILGDNKIAIFDFVSSGTVQYYLSKIIGRNLDGFYFVKINNGNKLYNNNIKAMFGEGNEYDIKYNIIAYYLFLESIFTDPNPPLIRCDENGNFIYDYEKIKYRNFNNIKECQNGIKNFVDDFVELNKNIIEQQINIEKADEILGMLKQSKTVIKENIKESFYLENMYDAEEKIDVWNALL